jgi:hypothetical protein
MSFGTGPNEAKVTGESERNAEVRPLSFCLQPRFILWLSSGWLGSGAIVWRCNVERKWWKIDESQKFLVVALRRCYDAGGCGRNSFPRMLAPQNELAN